MEFTDAKERLKHSWAADRDDFARVKSLLKAKNAEHHAQSGRLSQQLKVCAFICSKSRSCFFELCDSFQGVNVIFSFSTPRIKKRAQT